MRSRQPSDASVPRSHTSLVTQYSRLRPVCCVCACVLAVLELLRVSRPSPSVVSHALALVGLGQRRLYGTSHQQGLRACTLASLEPLRGPGHAFSASAPPGQCEAIGRGLVRWLVHFASGLCCGLLSGKRHLITVQALLLSAPRGQPINTGGTLASWCDLGVRRGRKTLCAVGPDDKAIDSAADAAARHWNKRYQWGAFAYLDAEGADELCQDVAKTIDQLGARSVLDVGCWHGNLLRHLKGLERYVGLDASTLAIDQARMIEVAFQTSFQAGCLEELPVQDRHFDAIYFGGCLGYTENPVGNFIKYAEKYNPRFLIWQEATKHLNLEKHLPELWMTSRFDLIKFATKEYTLEKFPKRKIAVFRFRDGGPIARPDQALQL